MESKLDTYKKENDDLKSKLKLFQSDFSNFRKFNSNILVNNKQNDNYSNVYRFYIKIIE